MHVISRALRNLLFVLCFIALIYLVAINYSFVFSKSVRGEVMEVERVMQPSTVIGSAISPDQMFSFAVLVRAESGEIFSSSSIDRQWAVVRKGYCVEARLYPYPPWDMEKADTYFNARLVKVLSDCKRAGAPTTGGASAEATAAPAGAVPSAIPNGSPTTAPVSPSASPASDTSSTLPAALKAQTPATPGTPPKVGLPGLQPAGHPAIHPGDPK